jgi:pyrimidine-specific ribonucleoside hydrolase
VIIADNVHGESGLDGPNLPEPAFSPQNCTAVELMGMAGEQQRHVRLRPGGYQRHRLLTFAQHPGHQLGPFRRKTAPPSS